MSDGFAELDEMIARVRAVATMPERIAPKVARELEREIVGNVRAARGPDGAPWAKTLDGHTPLQGAPAELDVSVEGKTRIVARLGGNAARHHLGWGKGGVRRAILPTATLPGPMASAVRRVAEADFRATTEGR